MNPWSLDRASSIGFGCASLGSRVGAKAGVAALVEAFKRGVNWFDLAHSYGDGRAEEIFSDFSRDRREEIYICTKCGIAVPEVGALASAVRPLARALVAYAPRLRKIIARGRHPAVRVPLTRDAILRSLERSLASLRTDYVDVFALHDPDIGDLARQDVRSTLYELLASGCVKAVGIAGSQDAIDAALRFELPIRHAQTADNPFNPAGCLAARLGNRPQPIHFITHSAFGTPDMLSQLVSLVRSERELERLLLNLGYELPLETAIRSALVDYSLKSNHSGTVLFSMFLAEHLHFNVKRAGLDKRPDPQPFFTAIDVKRAWKQSA